MFTKTVVWLYAGLILLGLAGQVSATQIEFGNPPTASVVNGFPFNSGDPLTRYQQVYASSFFPGPVVSIQSIKFFNTTSTSGAVFETADYEFTLSTSNFTVGNLDTVDLNNNPGGNAALFADVHLSGATGASFIHIGGCLGGSAFLYDPSAGDLLVDIVRSNQVGGGSSGLDCRCGLTGFGNDSSRAFDFGDSDESTVGLRTEFHVDVIPEPSTLTLAALALLALLAHHRRRRA